MLMCAVTVLRVFSLAFMFVETGSCYVVQADHELTGKLLPPPPKRWNCSHAPPCLEWLIYLFIFVVLGVEPGPHTC